MGVVYQCQHRLMRNIVALKVIDKKLIEAPGVIERFEREMRTAALLAHPNLVRAFDAEKAGDLHFLVLEFIEGVTLRRWSNATGRCRWTGPATTCRQARAGAARTPPRKRLVASRRQAAEHHGDAPGTGEGDGLWAGQHRRRAGRRGWADGGGPGNGHAGLRGPRADPRRPHGGHRGRTFTAWAARSTSC